MSPTATPETTAEAFARGGWHWPKGETPFRVTRCRGLECREPILWTITKLGRMAPYDRDGTSHFATCRDVEMFRR